MGGLIGADVCERLGNVSRNSKAILRRGIRDPGLHVVERIGPAPTHGDVSELQPRSAAGDRPLLLLPLRGFLVLAVSKKVLNLFKIALKLALPESVLRDHDRVGRFLNRH